MAAKKLYQHFMSRYFENFDLRYEPSWSRDLSIFSKLENKFGETKTEELIDLYFKSDYTRYNVRFFVAAINDLLFKLKQVEKRKMKVLKDIYDGDSQQ